VTREEFEGGHVLILGDCREELPGLACDSVITDPPYETVFHKARKPVIRVDGGPAYEREGFGFEGIDADRPAIAAAMVEAAARWVIVFCLAEGVRAWRDALQAAGGKWDTPLAWIKPDATPRLNGQGAARGFECIATAWAGRGHKRWNGGGRRGILTFNRDATPGNDHPTAKPVELMASLVTLYSNPGEIVLDPFAGSGSTGIACIQHGRRFIGIERQLRWFDLARRRIEAELKRPRLALVSAPRPMQAGLFTVPRAKPPTFGGEA
jgi:site-specific DNA-methyltransferase (adenine-specific)